nr:NADH dehydrogenase subunit 6 [Hypoponera sauteri]
MSKLIQLMFMFLWMFMLMMMFLILNKLMHPIIMMMFMIIFSILTCLNMSIWKMNFIYSIMIFLIMISGLMIIFMYFSSLISNEQFNINLNFKTLFLLILNLLVTFNLIYMNNLFILNQFNYFMFDSNSMKIINMNKFINVINLYTYPLNNFTILTILFILLSFISIIKINSSTHSFSMRKIYK